MSCECGKAIKAITKVLHHLLHENKGPSALDTGGCPIDHPKYPDNATPQQTACDDTAYAQYLAECAACGQDTACQANATANYLTTRNACFGIEN